MVTNTGGFDTDLTGCDTGVTGSDTVGLMADSTAYSCSSEMFREETVNRTAAHCSVITRVR